MTPLEIRNAIITQLSDNWDTTEIAWPNKNFDRKEVDEFIRLNILSGDSFEGEIGNQGVGYRTGLVIIDIFVKGNSGNKVALGYAGTLESLFRMIELGRLILEQASTTEHGIEAEGVFYHVSVKVPYRTFIGE